MRTDEHEWLTWIKDELDKHRLHCPLRPRAICVSQELFDRFSWIQQDVCGFPLHPEPERPVQWIRIDCACSAHGIEDHVAMWELEFAEGVTDGESRR